MVTVPRSTGKRVTNSYKFILNVGSQKGSKSCVPDRSSNIVFMHPIIYMQRQVIVYRVGVMGQPTRETKCIIFYYCKMIRQNSTSFRRLTESGKPDDIFYGI